MTNEFQDFDQLFSEDVEEVEYSYKLFGIEGTIPAKIPFGIILQYQRNKNKEDEDSCIEFPINMLETIFTKDVVDRWSANPRFDADRMTKVLQWALGKYGLGKKEDETPKISRGKLKIVKSE